MITTVSEDWYKQLDPLPEIHTIEEFIVQGPDGNSLPFIGYIEIVVNEPGVSNRDILVPVLVVPNTDYNLEVPVIVGTIVLKFIPQSAEGNLRSGWRTAVSFINHRKPIGTVRSTNDKEISIQPFESIVFQGL
ncbi:hypothetical protein DPMN_027821 [Dreissena polymorpha]|uniref:Uncharacterized protein n=1 Tax=Dreissena polymorpha TaxID=45954 RepID=A0A9D4RFW0_DREPO|nr:hypothetical protein DPMN_027821 [Dreissena polymorpha]